MRIILIMIIGLMLSNCTNSSYVKNKKTITSPDDLQKFINVYCNYCTFSINRGIVSSRNHGFGLNKTIFLAEFCH